MKVEFTSNQATPWGQFTVTPEDQGEIRLMNMMFGTASLIKPLIGITDFNLDEAGNVVNFSVGFVIPAQHTAGELTNQAKDAIAAQDVQEGSGMVLADPLPAGGTPLQSLPEQT
jgi:hypothetical protein